MIRANMIAGGNDIKASCVVYHSGGQSNVTAEIIDNENATFATDLKVLPTAPTVTNGTYTLKCTGSAVSSVTISLTSTVAGKATVSGNDIDIPANTETTVYTGALSSSGVIVLFK